VTLGDETFGGATGSDTGFRQEFLEADKGHGAEGEEETEKPIAARSRQSAGGQP
jgi:hypothetical protein